MGRLSPSERIIQVVGYSGKTYKAFALSVGRYRAQYLHDIAKGKTKEITSKVAKEIVLAYPEISYDWLIAGVGEMINTVPTEFCLDCKLNISKIITVNAKGEDVIPLVNSSVDYSVKYNNEDYIKNLDCFNIPNFNNGIFRMFKIEDDSMAVSFSRGSIVIAEWVENFKERISNGKIYVITYCDKIARENSIFIRRCYDSIKETSSLICKSDTLDVLSYPNLSLNIDFIKEIWEVKGLLKFDFPDPQNIYTKVDELEYEINKLKECISNKY